MSPFASFAVAAGLLTLTPGPDALLVLRIAVSRGRAGAAAAGLGVCTALAGWACAAAFGLTALLTAAPLLYTALRWAGAAYLAFLGARLIAGSRPWRRRRAAGQSGGPAGVPTGLGGPSRVPAGQGGPAGKPTGLGRPAEVPAGPGGPPAGPDRGMRRLGGCYLRGMLTNAANPKIGVFYLSLLPQFIPAGAPVLASSLLLAAIHVTESIAWFALIAVLAGRLGRSLRQPRVRRWADRAAGTAFLAFAARLAFIR
jgi:threonine/homoserine/homoserine lactone efflux protein